MPLDFDSFPMRLFRKSQELSWDALVIDYGRESEDWAHLKEDERHFLLRLVSGFLVGERGVTHDLAPLQIALRRQGGRMEDEMYLAAQLFEEARHVEFFQRWLDATLPGKLGVDVPYVPLSGDLFSQRLPEIMAALVREPSPEAQLRAVLIYHFYVEGIGAESTYPIFFDILEGNGVFPALLEGIRLIRRDEARHIAFGTYLLQRLLEEHPALEALFEAEIEVLKPTVYEGPLETFAPFGKTVPFGLDAEKYRQLFVRNFEAQRRAVYTREYA